MNIKLSSSILKPLEEVDQHRKWIASLQTISEIQQNTRYQKLINKNKRIRSVVKNYGNGDQNLLKSTQLLENNLKVSKKVLSGYKIKQKQIQSQAELLKVNFHHKKIQNDKNSIRRKQIQKRGKQIKRDDNELSKDSLKFYLDEVRRYNSVSMFGMGQSGQKQSAGLQRIKNALISSRRSIKTLYDHIQQIKLKRYSIYQKNTDDLKQSSQYQNTTQPSQQQLPKPQIQRNRLTKLNRNDESNNEKNELNIIKRLQIYKKYDIQRQMSQMQKSHNKKTEIVNKQLKKILYGANSLLDFPINPEHQGNLSQRYLNIVFQQQQMIKRYRGDLKNKRKLLQKFSSILTNVRKHDKLFAFLHKDK